MTSHRTNKPRSHGRPPLSPTRPRPYPTPTTQIIKSDLVIFLDLDETLVYTRRNRHNEPAGRTESNECEVLLEFKTDREWVTVFKRPYVDHFLRQLSNQFAEVYIFTAAVDWFADKVLDKLDPTKSIFTKRYYRDSCGYGWHPSEYVQNMYRKNVFQLDGISIDLSPKRYVFLDDNWIYTINDTRNTIPISPFNDARRKHDKALLKALELIRLLDDVEDVRPVIDYLFDCSTRHTFQQLNIIMDPIPVDFLHLSDK